LSDKQLMKNKMAQKASVEESLEVSNKEDEAPMEERPKADLADKKIDIEDEFDDDEPINEKNDRKSEEKPKGLKKSSSKKTKKSKDGKKLNKKI